MRDTFVKTLIDLAKEDRNIELVTGDLGFGVLKPFWEQLPDQFVNAGIAEQNMTSVAAGMALEGKTVFTYSIGNFPTLRCVEQIRNDCAYHDANVKVVCVGGGFVYGSLGMSHHATEDIAIMRALPGVTVFAPGDSAETVAAVKAMVKHPGTCYLRLGRGGEKPIHRELEHFEIGKAIRVREGRRVSLFSTGAIIEEVELTCTLLEREGMVDILYWSTDKLIIGWALGTAATAVYNIGASFNGYITGLSTAISGLLIPRLTEMAVKDAPKEEFTNLFIKIGRLQFILISFILSAFVAFGRQFILLWAGAEYDRAYPVALLTMIPVTVPLIQNTGLNILYALNKHKFRSIVYACVAVVNVGLTFWWVEDYGIVGAAMATCAAYVTGNIVIINWYYWKRIGIDIPLFWKNILFMSPQMFLMGAGAWFLLDRMVVDSWVVFFGMAVLYTVIYLPLAYVFMMNRYERDILMSPVKKVLRKARLLR